MDRALGEPLLNREVVKFAYSRLGGDFERHKENARQKKEVLMPEVHARR
jgi:hypothetical protein